VWFWALCLIGLIWLRRHLAINRARRDEVLSACHAEGREPLPTLSVLVAGKDEEPNIERCLAGLLGQEYPVLEVIAINDRSADRTGQIIDHWAAADARLKPVHVDHLPAGWAGKNHAMHVGSQRAIGEWLCFTDADCRFHSPRLLAAAVRYALRHRVDLLSVLPQLEARTFWERVVQPPAGAIMVFWFPPAKVNDPRSSVAYANGAFMLMPRAVYDRVGGHAQIRTALNEDMQLARRVKQSALRLRVIPGGGLYTVRMYTGFWQIWNGWSRIFYGCFGSWSRLIGSAVFLSVFSLLAPLSLLLSPLAGSAGPAIALAAGAALLGQQTVLWRFYRLCAMPSWWAVTYPLGAAVCWAMTINAMTRLLGVRTSWRGTIYQRRAMKEACTSTDPDSLTPVS